MSDRLTLSIDHDRRHRRAAEECEAAVFGAWYGETPQELRDTYEPWDDTCVFLVLADEEGVVHASARLLPPNPAGLMTLRDVAKETLGRGRRPQRGGGRARPDHDVGHRHPRHPAAPAGRAQPRGRAAARPRADDRGERRDLAGGDPRRPGAPVAGVHGIGTHTLPGTATQRYYGSPASTPVHVPIGRVLDTQRRRMPELHRLITLGIGLDGVHVAPREEFVLRSGTADLRGLAAGRHALALD